MIKPYGGKALTPLFVADDCRRRALGEEARHLPSVLMTSSASGNAVMLGAGYFSPLREFMNVGEALGVADGVAGPGLLAGAHRERR